MVPAESESQIAGDGRFVLLSIGLGMVFGLVAWRLPMLRTPARLESTVSREAAIVGNNMLLLAATMYRVELVGKRLDARLRELRELLAPSEPTGRTARPQELRS